MSVAPAALDKATLGRHPLDQYVPLIGEATAERIFKKADRVIDGRDVQLTGEVNDNTKEQFLAEAAALLFPSTGPSRSAWS